MKMFKHGLLRYNLNTSTVVESHRGIRYFYANQLIHIKLFSCSFSSLFVSLHSYTNSIIAIVLSIFSSRFIFGIISLIGYVSKSKI